MCGGWLICNAYNGIFIVTYLFILYENIVIIYYYLFIYLIWKYCHELEKQQINEIEDIVIFKALNEVVWLYKVYIDIQFEARWNFFENEFQIRTQASGVFWSNYK